jgi:hypothetical protein
MRSDPALYEPLIREGRIESAVSLTEGRPFAHDFACGAAYRSFSLTNRPGETS